MSDVQDAPGQAPLTIDEFCARLGVLRLGRGGPSYAEIAARIAERRLAAGATHARSRIARSSVYDVFRSGRAELDLELVEEILVALLLDEVEVERWLRAAARATPTAPSPTTSPAAFSDEQARPTTPLPSARAAASSDARTGRPRLPRVDRLGGLGGTTVLLLGCLALNLMGRQLVVLLELPLHLDMSGTAIAAIVAGPWWGALVGLSTNVVGTVPSGVSSLPFAAVNVGGALVWGYGVHRFGMGRSLARFFSLNLICAAVCSLLATPIVLAYRDDVVHGSDPLLDNLQALLQVAVLSVFLGNLLVSLVDKTLSGVVALVVVEHTSSLDSDLVRSPAAPASRPGAPTLRPRDRV